MMPPDEVPAPRRFLRDCLAAAIAQVQPGPAMARALADENAPPREIAVLALGKAAPGMAGAIESWLQAQGTTAVSGLVIGATGSPDIGPRYRTLVGGHPDPNAASAIAADGMTAFVSALPPTCEVHVALSGGTSALVAAPLPPITERELVATFAILHRAGFGIDEMNAVRKRITRWSAGRLALALCPRPVRVWLISDVIGDRIDVIRSGPCSGDPWTSERIAELVVRSGIASQLPRSVRDALATETLKPGDHRFDNVQAMVVASNSDAVAAAARCARDHGVASVIADEPLVGEAEAAGTAIAGSAIAATTPRTVYCWGGETTVRRGVTHGRGGRAQELALSAARTIRGSAVTVLASGTDGRDGPTDAAGAVVDGTTWDALVALGADPEGALAMHDSYPTLDRAGALIRTGPTGTNVMDIVLAFSGWA